MRLVFPLLALLIAGCPAEGDTDDTTTGSDADSDCSGGALASPTDLTASEDRSDRVLLSWTAPDGAAGYIVERADQEDGPFDEIGRTLNTTFTDTGLTEGRVLYYIVTAANADGESCPSDVAQGGTL